MEDSATRRLQVGDSGHMGAPENGFTLLPAHLDDAVKGQGSPQQSFSFQTPVVKDRSGDHSPLASVRQAANVRTFWGTAQVPAAAIAKATACPLELSEPSLKGVWTTACDEKLMRKEMKDDGENSPDTDVPPETMVRHLQHCVQTKPHSVVFRYLPGMGQGIREMTFETLGEKVRKCAQAQILKKSTLLWPSIVNTLPTLNFENSSQALIAAGIQQFDRVCIAGAGSPTWAIAYLGTMSAGAIPCALYANNAASSHLDAARLCGARALLTSNDQVAALLVSSLSQLPDLALVVLWDEDGTGPGKLPVQPDGAGARGHSWIGAFHWRDVMEMEAEPIVRKEHEHRGLLILPGMCAAMVLTPGTSGIPKAVMMSHDNWSWTAQTLIQQVGITPSDDILAWQPIASAVAQLLYVHVPLIVGCRATFVPVLPGCKTWEETYLLANHTSFNATSNQNSSGAAQHAAISLLKSIRPTVIVGAADMWEHIAWAVRAEIDGIRGKSYAWALQQGRDAGTRLQGLQGVGSKGLSWGLAKRLVFSKIWANLGLDKCRYASGIGRYCNKNAMELLLSVGIPVLWMYGTAECSGVASLSPSSKGHNKLPGFRIGYSGRALKHTRITLRRRPDSETARCSRILVKGRNVMMGYFRDPAGTASVFDKDGTLHTGDCGEVDWGTQLLLVEAREHDIIKA
jgi:long-chain acyl-CoA synthetase